MNLKELNAKAREKYNGFCRVCRICDGEACKGETPGMGGAGLGASFTANYKALNNIRLNMRTIHDVKIPEISINLFNKEYSMPVIIAPITGMTYNCGGSVNEEEYAKIIAEAGEKLNILTSYGDGAQEELYLQGIKQTKRFKDGLPIIKPRENSEIIKRIKMAEKVGAGAVGVDIDGAGLLAMAIYNQPVSPKTEEEIMQLVASTNLPFILKGIMTPDEAERAVNCGAKAIVVSNHGGRALDCTPGVAEVLPLIAERVKGKVTIIADGAVRTGSDVLKYLALGADAVMIGRPIITGAYGGGVDGVELILNKIKNELIQSMLLTGTKSVKDVNRNIIF